VQSNHQSNTPKKALLKTEDFVILCTFYVPAFNKTTDVNFKS